MPRLTARAIDRLPALFWVCVLAIAAFLAFDTGATIGAVGLYGARPPLSIFQTGIRIVLGVSSLGLLLVRRDLFERLTLLTCAAAAASSTLYGFGLRSPGLSAFRLVSHLVMYFLVAIVAGRMIARAEVPSRRDLAWWVPVLLTVHNAEEALTFRDYLPRLPALLPQPLESIAAQLSYPAMLAALIAVSAAAILGATVASSGGGRGAWWALLALEATMALNVVAHVASALLVFHGYGPGLITAVGVNAPFAIYFFRRAVREHWVSPAALRATVPAALVLHGPALFAVLWLASRWTR